MCVLYIDWLGSKIVSYEFTSYLKFWAVVSIVAAHVYIENDTTLVLNYIKVFLNYFGSIGVGLFFIVAGFLWGKKGVNINKSIDRLVLPWLISGSCIFFYVYIRKADLSFDIFNSYFSYILGQGSYLYYMTVYFAFMLSIRIWGNKYSILIFSLSSFVYYAFQVPVFHIYLGLHEHLNPLLWFPYIYLGMYIESILSFIKRFNKHAVMIFMVVALLIFYQLFEYETSNHIGYLSMFRVFFTFCCFLFLSYLNSNVNFSDSFNLLGKQSLFIYLWHMPFVGILNFVANQYFEILHLFTVPFVLLFFMLLIRVLSNRKCRYCRFLGFR